MVCFGDLKNYDFHFKVALIQSTEKIETIKGKKLAKGVDKETIELIKGGILANLNTQKELKYLKQTFMLDQYLVFYDNSPAHPSMLLNNILFKELAEFRKSESPEEIKKLVLVKDKISQLTTEVSLDNSFYCEVVFKQ